MYRTRFTIPALVATIGLLLAGCGDDGSNDAATDTGSEPAATSTADAEFTNADVEFAQGMIPHHQQAVEMAQMVPDEGVSPELVTIADAIEGAQQPEIDQMTTMLKRWGEDAPSTGMGEHGSMDGMMSSADMDALASMNGTEFEQMFLIMMIEHHEGAISMAQTELAEGQDPEAQALAQAIIDTQQSEITQMEQLLQAAGA